MGVVAVIVALEIGELTSIFPDANGASYSFVYEAFGSELGFITGVILYFSYASAISVVALGFGSYLESLLGLPGEDVGYVAIALIAVLAVVNLGGIRKAARVDFGLVVVKLGVLILVVGFALAHAGKVGSATNFLSVPVPSSGITGIFSSSVAVFFAYSGFQVMSTFAPTIKGGARAAARAILLSVLVSMILYVLVTISLLVLVPSTGFTIDADPLAFALSASHSPGNLLTIVDLGALVATASASLAPLLSSSRILLQIGLDGLLPRVLRWYDKGRDVARNGVLASAFIGVAMLYSGNIFVTAAISNFGLLFSYLVASLSLIHLRRLGKRRSFSVPGYPHLPIAAMLAILALMVGMPKEALLFGLVTVLLLLIVYYSLREYEEKEPVKIRFFE